MLSLIRILEYIRRQRKYLKKELLKALDISDGRFEYMLAHERIDDELIPKWIKFLDLKSVDPVTLVEYNNRHRIYQQVGDIMPMREGIQKLIADILFVQHKVPVSKMQELVFPHLLSVISKQAYEIREAIASLKEAENDS